MAGCYAKISRKRWLRFVSSVSHRKQNFPLKISNMATADITRKLANVQLGEDGGETEREGHFWNRALVSMKFSVEPAWLEAAWNSDKRPNFGMRNLDAVLEERCCLKLELTGPLIDSFLKEIGKGLLAKLGRSRCTGLMAPVKVHIPYNVFRHICTLCVGYGADMKCDEKGKITLKIISLDIASKVFSPVRCGGFNVLRKRLFGKTKGVNGRNILAYQGRAAVVVGKSTPILLEYSQRTEKLTTTFYVQRYDKEDFALDLQLQALSNSDS